MMKLFIKDTVDKTGYGDRGLSIAALFAVILALASCAAAPSYRPLSPQGGAACPDIFPAAAARLIHQIEITSPLSGKSLFVGAVKVEPEKDALHAVLMSVEGMVLFEAETAGADFRMISAVPPLNDLPFAKGLMGDISFVMLKPAGKPVEQGADDQGLWACRWPTGKENILETALTKDGNIRLRLYGANRKIIKEAAAFPPFDRKAPAFIKMKSFGPASYTIDLKLIEMESVD
ncbi:MAG: hypothetical protein JW943_10560 [Deltaproteobacteria bacterium]|nr:hypothetical protein [Deltaproteobacteria bacterium]